MHTGLEDTKAKVKYHNSSRYLKNVVFIQYSGCNLRSQECDEAESSEVLWNVDVCDVTKLGEVIVNVLLGHIGSHPSNEHFVVVVLQK